MNSGDLPFNLENIIQNTSGDENSQKILAIPNHKINLNFVFKFKKFEVKIESACELLHINLR